MLCPVGGSHPAGAKMRGKLNVNRPACCFLVIILAVGCSGRSPLAPEVTSSARVSGWVYASVDWADPPVPNAHIEVHAADGSTVTTVSDLRGFYEVSVPVGNVMITTSKEGYETRTYEGTLLTHTTLNFFLQPEEDYAP